MTDVILIVVLLVIIGGACGYIYKAKKSGVKCVGCPSAKTCASAQSACAGSCASCAGGCAHAKGNP